MVYSTTRRKVLRKYSPNGLFGTMSASYIVLVIFRADPAPEQANEAVGALGNNGDTDMGRDGAPGANPR